MYRKWGGEGYCFYHHKPGVIIYTFHIGDCSYLETFSSIDAHLKAERCRKEKKAEK